MNSRFPAMLGRAGGFTVLELAVAMSVLILLLGIIVAITNSVGQTVRWTSAKIDAFASARSSFELITRRVASATINTYWDYDDPLAPKRYLRASDLQFVIQQNTQNPAQGQELYFAAPESFSESNALRSTNGLLNACSFFVQYGDYSSFRPTAFGGIRERWRYRLMQGIQPSENFGMFKGTPPSGPLSAIQTYWSTFWQNHAWTNPISNAGSTVSPYVSPIAENVIALNLRASLPQAEDPSGLSLLLDPKSYHYDSKADEFADPQPRTANQLPPTLKITIVTLSEASSLRLDPGVTPPSAIATALLGKFQDPATYEEDITKLSATLSIAKLDFQIFTTTVTLRESKWSDPN